MKYLGKRKLYELAKELFVYEDTLVYFSKFMDSYYKKYRGMEWLTVYGHSNKYVICTEHCGKYLSIEVYDEEDCRIMRKVLNGFGKCEVNIAIA